MEDFNHLLECAHTKISFINSILPINDDEYSIDLPSYINEKDIEGVYEILDRRHNKNRKNNVFGGAPLLERYICIIHKDILNDLNRINLFIPMQEYPCLLSETTDNEVGCFFNIRFFVIDDSRLIEKSGSLNLLDIYACIMFEENNVTPEEAINMRVTKYRSPHN